MKTKTTNAIFSDVSAATHAANEALLKLEQAQRFAAEALATCEESDFDETYVRLMAADLTEAYTQTLILRAFCHGQMMLKKIDLKQYQRVVFSNGWKDL